MTLKDYVTILLSGFAFILSLTATAISLRQKKYEIERTLRSQLTDAIGKLNTAFESIEKLRLEKFDIWGTPPLANMRSFYNGQKLFYAKQAIYVAEQIPKLVSDAEYNSIARAFSDLDDENTAFRYYELAIAAATTSISKATNLRGYARLLLRNGQEELGRKRFSEALELVSDGTDSAHWFRAETLQRWAQIEAEFCETTSADLFDKAEKEFNRIFFPSRRTEGLINLQSVRKNAMNWQEKIDK